MANRFTARRKQLLRIIREEGVDAMLVTGETNVRYLTGFTGDSSYLLLGPKIEIIITDSRYTTQLEEECPGMELYVRSTSEPLHQAAGRVIHKAKITRIGYERHLMVVELLESLKGAVKTGDWVPVGPRIENELRSVKDAGEIAETRAAVHHAERAFQFMRACLTPEATERELAYELEGAIRRFGGTGFSFPPIVAVGDRAALPHYAAGYRKVGEDRLLLVDWGAQTESGYKSDLTRTLCTGKPTAKLRKIYNIVLKAQERAIRAIRPGRKCSVIDAKARTYIDEQGYGKYFGHGLGHGIGLQIHEQPRFSPHSDLKLVPGMIVTVEPGIYLPGWGGVRIEDDVLVTEEGNEVLSTLPRDFEAMCCP